MVESARESNKLLKRAEDARDERGRKVYGDAWDEEDADGNAPMRNLLAHRRRARRPPLGGVGARARDAPRAGGRDRARRRRAPAAGPGAPPAAAAQAPVPRLPLRPPRGLPPPGAARAGGAVGDRVPSPRPRESAAAGRPARARPPPAPAAAAAVRAGGRPRRRASRTPPSPAARADVGGGASAAPPRLAGQSLLPTLLPPGASAAPRANASGLYRPGAAPLDRPRGAAARRRRDGGRSSSSRPGSRAHAAAAGQPRTGGAAGATASSSPPASRIRRRHPWPCRAVTERLGVLRAITVMTGRRELPPLMRTRPLQVVPGCSCQCAGAAGWGRRWLR